MVVPFPKQIVGEKEIATELGVRENTVHQWWVHDQMPAPDGLVSGNPAWHWGSVRDWAWRTGRHPVMRRKILQVLAATGTTSVTPVTEMLVSRGWVGPDTTPTKIASILTELNAEGYVELHGRREWRITDEGRQIVGDIVEDKESKPMTYQPTPEEIIRIFKQWEHGAWRSPNRKVSANAPLEPPTLAEARALVPRLEELRQQVETARQDWHGRPIGDRNQAAMGQLWEEWRDDKLGVLNGYRDVWRSPDPFYDSRPL